MDGPVILAVETSTRLGSVALRDRSGRIAQRDLEKGAVQGRLLAPAAKELLQAQGLEPGDVEWAVAGVGPGSYTGLRVGIVMIEAFAFAVGCFRIGVNSFEILALSAGREGEEVVTLAPAGEKELYFGLYRIEQGYPRSLREPAVGGEEQIAALVAAKGRAVLGEGADAFVSSALRVDASAVPSASSAAALAEHRIRAGKAPLQQELRPLYLRPSKAELNWKRRGG